MSDLLAPEVKPFEISEDVQLVNPDHIARDKTRYLFFVGDVIDPRRKQQRQDLRHGGEELTGRTAKHTRGFLPRCFFTPLTVSGEPLPRELVPEGMDAFEFQTQRPDARAEGGFTTVFGDAALVGVKSYPGEEIVNYLGGPVNLSDGQSKGLVEIVALQGVEFGDRQRQHLQNFFFPDLQNLPRSLRIIEEMLREARGKSSDQTLREIAETMLTSAEQFRLWGVSRVEVEHSMVREGRVHNYTHSYTGLAEVLMEQLEIPRQDQGLKQVADLNTRMVEAVSRQASPQDIAQATAAALSEAMIKNGEIQANQQAAVMQMMAQTIGIAMAEALRPITERINQIETRQQPAPAQQQQAGNKSK